MSDSGKRWAEKKYRTLARERSRRWGGDLARATLSGPEEQRELALHRLAQELRRIGSSRGKNAYVEMLGLVEGILDVAIKHGKEATDD